MSWRPKNLPAYIRETRASAVEFVLIFPFLFFLITLVLDAGNYFADRRMAGRLAESIVRTARSLDQPLTNTDSVPLQPEQIQLLRNIANRIEIQMPGQRNYIWLGRYVRPQSATAAAPSNVRQLLPNGLAADNNAGISLFGSVEDVIGVDANVMNQVEAFALPGEIIYVVEIGISRRFITPLPMWMRQRLSKIRYL